MKFATIKPDDLAIVHNDTLIPITGVLAKEATMLDLIAQYDQVKAGLADLAAKGGGTKLDPKQLKPPVERPSKIWAAAGNYKRGSGGLDDARGRGTASKTSPEELLENIFLKPPSAIAGPEDNIIIPKNADSVFPELELCVVIGKQVRNLTKAQAMDAIFGYTIMLDMTARGYGLSKNMSGTRSVRKGSETFAPIGPWITTKDEIADPHNLWMKLWINGELKQSAKTDAMSTISPRKSASFPGDDSVPRRPADDRQSGLAGVSRETRKLML